MKIKKIAPAGQPVYHIPFGDTRTVMQAFPLGLPSHDDTDCFFFFGVRLYWDSTDVDDYLAHQDEDDVPIWMASASGF